MYILQICGNIELIQAINQKGVSEQMKTKATRIIAVVLAALMMLTMCGCEDMLYLLSEYAMNSADLDSLYGSSTEDFDSSFFED